MPRPRKGQPAPGQQTHGTSAGFVMHQQRGTPPCGPCRHARNAWRRENRLRGKCAPGLGWPLQGSAEGAGG